MPTLNVNGADIYYEEQGSGYETIVFAHGLLWDHRMFADQIRHLKDRYRCIAFDFRGQGRSEVTESGYDMDTLTDDAVGLIKALDCTPCHFLGLSMGGFVAMRLGIRHPDLIKSLMLLETTSEPESAEKKRQYRLLNFVARWFGLGVVANRVMPIMFGSAFLQDPVRAELRNEWCERMIANHRLGITRAVGGVIDRDGVYDQIDRITAPTLIIIGDQDVATPLPYSERMHERIPNSKLVTIPRAGHTSTIEEPEAVNEAIDTFLKSL